MINKEDINSIEINKKKKTIKIAFRKNIYYSLKNCSDFFYNEIKASGYEIIPEFTIDVTGIKREQIIENILYIIEKKHTLFSKIVSYGKVVVKEKKVDIIINSEVFYEKGCEERIAEKITGILFETYGISLDIQLKCEIIIREYKDIEKTYSHKADSDEIVSSVKKNTDSFVVLGKEINEQYKKVSESDLSEGNECIVIGKLISKDIKNIRDNLFLNIFVLTDNANSISVKFFSRNKNSYEKAETDKCLIVQGKIKYDSYSRKNIIEAKNICTSKDIFARNDTCKIKRTELHLHTKMSALDGISDIREVVKLAKKWGHKAVAITDHGVIQGYPEAMNASRETGIKIIYGVEGYLVDSEIKIVRNPGNNLITDEIVVFDLETTGLSPSNSKIIEIGAVKIKEGGISDTFNIIVNPGVEIPEIITEITGIKNEDVKNGVPENEAIDLFKKFIGSAEILCAHNASFDYSFIKKYDIFRNKFAVIDTLELSRALLQLKNYKLATVAAHFDISLKNHHRASADALCTGRILISLFEILKERKIMRLNDINLELAKDISFKDMNTYHIIILVKNNTGLKNLYRIISESHIKYFHKKPRIPKSLLVKYREGLIIGSACEAGELFRAFLNKSDDGEIEKIAQFYDYLEIQPVGNNIFLIEKELLKNEDEIKEINRKIFQLGERLNKPVCATGDVHFINPEDSIFREILLAGQEFQDYDKQPPLYFRTTDEMLEEFAYLGEKEAEKVVIEYPAEIESLVENAILPIPEETFPPVIEGADTELREIVWENAKKIYGTDMPEIVRNRLERELSAIISNGYAVMYIIAKRLVEKSLNDGYVVGSRGSVGSSFAATMSNITEVNPLPAHYYCCECCFSDFSLSEEYDSGYDLPDKTCPECGNLLNKDGHNIPFEVFMGFRGEKEPDIDLNFAGEEQNEAMKYAEELFGEGFVFRAGTISTIASKTAFGFVQGYADQEDIEYESDEKNRLIEGITGIKRTTGQHPGGVMIIPKNMDVHDFTPVQYPANKSDSETITTHFDYHSLSGKILKLDILGHDAPSILKMLEIFTGIRYEDIPKCDKRILSIFTSPCELGVTEDDIKCKVGTIGIPEFGTEFVRQMLLDTKPESFSELVRISGLSHGTDVWINNAQDLVKKNIATLSSVISTRDDIMTYLIRMGVESRFAFEIMERVRKGKGLTTENINIMKEKKIPDWYIESCEKIKYMFPKAHAAAYVMMSVKIAYFKVNFPLAFYAAYFTMKSEDFEAKYIINGKDILQEKMSEIINTKVKTEKMKNIYTVLEVAREMYARGYEFISIDIYESHHSKFLIKNGKILPPLTGIENLGSKVAKRIYDERNKKRFISVEDMAKRTKANKACIEALKSNGCLEDMDMTNQISLFSI